MRVVITPSGTEKLVPDGVGAELRSRVIADTPTKALLDTIDDGVWLEIAGTFYRNDLGAWLIGEMHPDPAMRFNAVDAAWIARTHRRKTVKILEPAPATRTTEEE